MKIKLVLVGIGIVIAILGLYITSRPITIGGGTNSCSVANGCMATGTVEVPSVGLGMLVFVAGLVTLIYGYRREGDQES